MKITKTKNEFIIGDFCQKCDYIANAKLYNAQPVDFYNITDTEKENLIQLLKKTHKYKILNHLPVYFTNLTHEVFDNITHFMFINKMIRIGLRGCDYKIDDINIFISDGRFLPIYRK